jgi:ZIP family zinc transporter
MDTFWFALFLTTFAGIVTMIGGLLSTLKALLNRGMLAIALGFAAGAMLYVSFTDILGKSLDAFSELHDATGAYGMMAIAFFTGLAVMIVINRLIPKDINPNEQEGVVQKTSAVKRRLMRSGVLIGVALCLHNFPEGFLVFMSAYDDPGTGLAVAIALAIHNIPEGVAIGAPLYAATKNRLKTIGLTALTGIAEPIGAILGFLLLRDFLSGATLGWVFGVVAGMMVFICVDELLPAAKRFETNQQQTTYGFIGGMAVLALSITFLQ